MTKLFTTIFGLLLLVACAGQQQPAARPTAPTILFEAEAGYTAALAGVAAYLHLPSCGQPGASAVCRDADVAAKMRQAVDAAAAEMVAAEILVLGCPAADYAANKPCGKPVADQSAAEQAVSAAQAAVTTLAAIVPVITGGR